ncbi:MAG: MBL fold metallo-hydrolase [Candidatus Ornithospirochaeta sp.]
MLHYVALTTGSCGNCYIFYDGETSFAIDCGVTLKKFVTEMEMHSMPVSSLSAMFLTHLHPDHAKGVGAVQRKLGVPVFVSSVCLRDGKCEMEKMKMEKKLVFPFSWGDSVGVGKFEVIPFRTSHDSPGSSGYFIIHGDTKIFLMTDTGVIPEEAYSYAKVSSIKFIESNYDAEMLSTGPYPSWLKARVRGEYGHLSNDDAINFARATSTLGDQLYFIHVSDNNNDTAIIKEMVRNNIPSGIFCKVAERGEMFEGFWE